MKLAIMQPYLFPYIGYFQLIHAADTFLLLDDVAYINKGWINRNRILVNGKEHAFVLPVEGASQNRLINSLTLLPGNQWRNKLEATITMAYKKSAGYASFFPVLKEILTFEPNHLSAFIANSIRALCHYLEIKTTIITSTAIYNNTWLKGQERIIDLCQKEHAGMYINAAGGRSLYDKEAFAVKGISLVFLQSQLNPYPQYGAAAFVPGLSIIDLLMNNPKAMVQEALNHYTLA
jgi:hypothetical protein